jgi:hypothetical protein
MKNKPYPALLGGSYLFNEIKKRTPKSRETIPLRYLVYWYCAVLSSFSQIINYHYFCICRLRMRSACFRIHIASQLRNQNVDRCP